MNKEMLADLQKRAEDFGSIAQNVNDSSKLRKKHSKEAIELLKQCIEIGDILNHEIEIISKANKQFRDQDNLVLNSCIIIDSNLKEQKKILRGLKKTTILEDSLAETFNEKIRTLSESINKALSLVQEIIRKDNEIILMDNLIINRKQFQKESIQQLRKLSLKTLEDAENAIRGSSSNLNRGMKMIKGIVKVQELIDRGERDELLGLIDDAVMGWEIAENVNKSSATQLEFAEKVKVFTKKLHEDSNTIKNMVISKHELFKYNLELITELTVILSLELKDYLDIQEKLETINYDLKLPKKERDLVSNLLSYINIACKDIHTVSNLNYDMTESINLNADLEKKLVDLTNMELEYFSKIKDEVNSMTENTRYPIEGSRKNIENGKIIEKHLKKIVKTLK